MAYSDYDAFAWIYNRYWGSAFTAQVLPIIEKLILSHLPENATLLDVCCGTGNLANLLTQKGYTVTGVDGSTVLLNYARENAPQAEFIHADAREFSLPARYHAAFSCYDSLNHILTFEEMTAVFRNVNRALLDGGYFLFDLNMEKGFETRWRSMFNIMQPDHVVAVQMYYRAAEKRGLFDAAIFLLKDSLWQRSDVNLVQAS